MLQSLLAADAINVLEYGYEIGLNWLGKFAQAIIEGIGIIGLGIIVFTIVLKAITLPFDIYQRVSMRKQNLIMREMQPELEKLQKQYANDKNTYNKKMMELYKKNGYSMLGACLPMIFSLVILIVAFQGFRTYSQYANLAMYEKMSQAYSEEIIKFAPEFKDFGGGRTYFILTDENEEEDLTKGKLKWSDERDPIELENVTYRPYLGKDSLPYLEVTSSVSDKFITYLYQVKTAAQIKKERVKFAYYVDTDKFGEYLKAHGSEPFDENNKELTKQAVYDQIHEKAVAEQLEDLESKVANRYVIRIGATAAANWYRAGNDSHFLWVKNVWYPDVSYNNPIQSYDKFKSQLNAKITLKDGTKISSLSDVLGRGSYEDLTSQLTKEKSQPNGYFILIILSIGFMVLSQFISMRSNKESNKYQTVNGQGAKTQKMMLVVMPLIYAVFAFMYSAAFSIYMTVSSVISLLTTVIANFIIGRVFKKREETKIQEQVTRKYAWQLTEKEKRAKEKQAKKEAKMKERANRFKNRK